MIDPLPWALVAFLWVAGAAVILGFKSENGEMHRGVTLACLAMWPFLVVAALIRSWEVLLALVLSSVGLLLYLVLWIS